MYLHSASANGWLRSYWLLLRWDLLRARSILPMFLVIQSAMAAGIVLGLSFLVPHADQQTALYLTTGSMTVALITVGMVGLPQVVSQQKLEGVFDYQRSLPVPRFAALAADGCVWTLVAIPGVVLSLVLAILRFHLKVSSTPLVIPAAVLVALTAISIGYGIAYALNPAITGLVTQAIMIVALMFSPVNYPADRMPTWLADIQRVLPFGYMSQAIRSTVNVPTTGVPLEPFIVLVGWSVLGLAITGRVMTRRD